MNVLIGFLLVRNLFLGMRPSKNIKKSDIKILVHTPIAYKKDVFDTIPFFEA